MSLCLWPPGETGSEADAIVARPFGTTMSDVVVDFSLSPNDVIDAVLKGCLSRPDGTFIDGMEIADWNLVKRRQGLLAVAVATRGPRRIVTSACEDAACGEKLDLEVDLEAFRHDWRAEDLLFDNGRLRLPRPTDLVTVGADAPERLAQILFVGAPPERPGWEVEAESALSDADPLGDLELRAECFSCGAPIAVPLILEIFLLAELSNMSTRLLDEIHVLAFAYHWTESEIMALPESRRRHYLARIQEAWAA